MEATVRAFGIQYFEKFVKGQLKETEKGVKYIIL